MPKEWKEEGFIDPVCRLIKNLYGHPRAGNGWERHYEEFIRRHGFELVPEWPSVYFNEQIGSALVEYVDDFLAAGPEGPTRALFDVLKGEI